MESSPDHLGIYALVLTIALIRRAPRRQNGKAISRGWGNRLQESDADWVIVRAGIVTNGAATGSYRHGRNVGNFIIGKKISRADVADFMLRQLTDDTYVRTAPGVCA